MKLTKKFDNTDFYQNFLPLSHRITDNMYNDLRDLNPERFDELMELHEQCFSANFSKRKSKGGESAMNAILADMLDAEISKRGCKILSERNALAQMLMSAYRQNKHISRYLDCDDVFKISRAYMDKLTEVVDNLYTDENTLEDIVALALNYAQFTSIYAFDSELARPKIHPKRHTEFEKELFEGTLFYAVEAMDILLEMGQSAYVALYGGRSVCTGQAIMTAGIIDMAFKKLGLDGYSQMVSNGEHAFVLVVSGDKKYVVDPTQYFGTFKEIKKCDKRNAESIKGADILKLKKYDSDAHFKVVNYFLNELDLVEKFKDSVAFDDVIPIKLTKIIGHIEKNLSKMSALIYPKGVYIGDREFGLPFYFELCLNATNIPYKTGCGTEDFIIYDNSKMYHIDTSKMFDAKNKMRNADKFMMIKDCTTKDHSL